MTETERRGLLGIADVLIGAAGELRPGGQIPEIEHWLVRAVLARRDGFDVLMEIAGRCAPLSFDRIDSAMRTLSVQDPTAFTLLSSVVAGAYLMSPHVRPTIGYPGQERHYPAFDQVAEEVSSGILDPVIARGALTRSAGQPPWASR